MNTLTRFLDWLDEAAAGFIRLAYLLAGITAVALYFGAGHLPTFIEDPLNGALPWVLASAVEIHTYITARRVRAAWQEKNWTTLKVNLAILAGLLSFSAWNQLNYLADTWQPPIGALALPSWLAYGVRAFIVPCAFMAAAFLAPLAEPVTAQIENEARATLTDVFKIARKQRRKMLRDAERSGRDMTGALVELVSDPETRRIISHAYNAIGAPVKSGGSGGMIDAPWRMVEASPTVPETRTDALTSTPANGATDAPANTAGVTISTTQLTPYDGSTRPPTGRGTPTRKRGVRTPRKSSAKVVRLRNPSVEERAAAAWSPGMSIPALQKAAGISRPSAQKYHAKFSAQTALTEQQAQQPQQVAQ